MSVRAFIDTNLLIYLYSEDEPRKRTRISETLLECVPVVSTQVLQELSNTLSKKFKMDWETVRLVLTEVESVVDIQVNNSATIHSAIGISDRYGYSFYDSLIIAAALESGCTVLLSEDMHHDHLVEGTLQIKNPLKT